MTTNGTHILPTLRPTGVSLWTPTGPRIIPGADMGPHTPTPTGTDSSHTTEDPSPVGPHTEPDTGTNPSPAPSHTDPVGTHIAGDTDTEETPDDQEVPPVGTDVGTDVGTHVGTHDDDTEKGTPMHLSDTDRTALATLDSKAEQIRYICGTLGNPDTVEVHTWLDAAGVEATRKYVSRVVNDWRKEKGMDDTGAFPTVTDDDLAELDAHNNTGPQTDEPAEWPAESEEIAAELAASVREAKAKLPLQSESALMEVLSEDELAAERKLAEQRRATRRKIEESQLAAELARAKRAQANEEAIAKSEASDARWLQRARSKKRRLASPDAKLAEVVRNSVWSSRALIAAVAGGMIWSAFNAQQNLVPDGNMANPLYWLSFFVEAMISLPLIVIMVASATASRCGHTPSDTEKRKVLAVELVLLAMTLMLNVGKHLFPPEGVDINWMDVFKFGVAPVMVGVLLQVHAQVSDHYAGLILGADQAPTATQSDEEPDRAH